MAKKQSAWVKVDSEGHIGPRVGETRTPGAAQAGELEEGAMARASKPKQEEISADQWQALREFDPESVVREADREPSAANEIQKRIFQLKQRSAGV